MHDFIGSWIRHIEEADMQKEADRLALRELILKTKAKASLFDVSEPQINVGEL